MKRLTVSGTLIAALTFSTLAGAMISRGPYLQQGTPNAMTIVWRTLLTSSSTVHYGTSADALTESQSVAKSVTQHEVRLEGLAPNTRYFYAVVDTDNTQVTGPGYFFETAPVVGSTDKRRIWVVGDSGTGGSKQAAVRDAMLWVTGATRPDIYLHMGDMAYGSGTETQFQFNFFGMYDAILRNTVCWPTMGNHEGKSSDSDTQEGPYYDAYVLPTNAEAGGLASGTEAYYSFDYANIHFVVLDSHDSDRSVGGAMLTWMASDLAATDQDWIIAYWHHPPYTKGSHDSDKEGQLIQMRENALPLLEAAGVDLVLGGHSHIYERSYLIDGAYDTPTTAAGKIVDNGDGDPQGDGPYTKTSAGNEGTVYVVAGHGGTGVSQKGTHPIMAVTEKANGSCIIDVHGKTLTLQNIRSDNQVTDTFSLMKGDGLLVTAPNGGESFVTNDAVTITWITVGSIPTVSVHLSYDGGLNWLTLAGEMVNTGSYAWVVPPVITNQTLIRVQSPDGQFMDESDGTFGINNPEPYDVIPWNDVWRYLDEGPDQGDAWLAVDFDDSSWKEGAGQLGYGDNDESTVLADKDPNVPSVYFRNTFALDLDVSDATVKVLHDDGVAVWINGQLVIQEQMINGVSYAVYSGSASDNTVTTQALGPNNPLHKGQNVVSVMVKQKSESSSDLSFDLQLNITPEPPPPPAEPEPIPEPVADISPEATVVEVIDDAGPMNPESDDIPSHSEVIIGPDPEPAPVSGKKSGGCQSVGTGQSGGIPWPPFLLFVLLAVRLFRSHSSAPTRRTP